MTSAFAKPARVPAGLSELLHDLTGTILRESTFREGSGGEREVGELELYRMAHRYFVQRLDRGKERPPLSMTEGQMREFARTKMESADIDGGGLLEPAAFARVLREVGHAAGLTDDEVFRIGTEVETSEQLVIEYGHVLDTVVSMALAAHQPGGIVPSYSHDPVRLPREVQARVAGAYGEWATRFDRNRDGKLDDMEVHDALSDPELALTRRERNACFLELQFAQGHAVQVDTLHQTVLDVMQRAARLILRDECVPTSQQDLDAYLGELLRQLDEWGAGELRRSAVTHLLVTADLGVTLSQASAVVGSAPGTASCVTVDSFVIHARATIGPLVLWSGMEMDRLLHSEEWSRVNGLDAGTFERALGDALRGQPIVLPVDRFEAVLQSGVGAALKVDPVQTRALAVLGLVQSEAEDAVDTEQVRRLGFRTLQALRVVERVFRS